MVKYEFYGNWFLPKCIGNYALSFSSRKNSDWQQHPPTITSTPQNLFSVEMIELTHQRVAQKENFSFFGIKVNFS